MWHCAGIPIETSLAEVSSRKVLSNEKYPEKLDQQKFSGGGQSFLPERKKRDLYQLKYSSQIYAGLGSVGAEHFTPCNLCFLPL